MRDVADWLAGLGLAQYADAFAAEDVDFSVLAALTDQDLKDLGVASLGHRRKILAAAAAPALVPAAPREEAERRPITVMFCDLVGSTSLAATLDAEDWRDLVGAYLDEASRAVAGFGGHVLKKLGDGLMALFGYPQAQENDAERAARAGLAILRALDELNARNAALGKPALAARIGLDSGPVVVDATGEVFGEAANVAARVQAAAEPGTLWVTANVARQIAGLFVAEDKGPHELKGVPGKPTLYRLARAGGGGRRAGARSLTPFVGRDDELAQLERRWERARGGEGQFVQIVGEPGLGKSRLIHELRARVAATPHTWVEWAASQLLQNTPLHPLAEWGRQRFVGEARFADLEAALRSSGLDANENAPLLAPLLDIPAPEEPALAPEELRRRQLAAIVAWIVAAARSQPLLLAFEDLHWADPTTLDLMKTLAERGARGALMIVATARPEFRAPWPTRSHHGVIALSPLGTGDIRAMVAAIAERHALTNQAIEGVAERTGGVPLFVEEVTRLLLEGGGHTIPPTLQQSLAARLDRLGEAREAAQIGAVLGREFSYALLRSVAAISRSREATTRDLEIAATDARLDAALEKLADADLLFVDGVPPKSSYRFKHALIQDAAYESLLKSRRQALHRRAAEALIAAPDRQAELVAHHFTEASATDAAIEWWGKAGDAALRRSAFQEAIAHLGKAIGLADGVEDKTSARRATASSTAGGFKTKYAQAVMIGEGYTAASAKLALQQVDARGATLGEIEQVTLLHGRWGEAALSGRFAEALAIAEAALREGSEKRRRLLIGCAHLLICDSQSVLGDFAAARAHAEAALALYDESEGQAVRGGPGFDFLTSAHSALALPLFVLGECEAAARHCEWAEARARQIEQPFALATYYNQRVVLLRIAERAPEALRLAEDFATLVADKGMRGFALDASLHRAWANGRIGDHEAAARSLAQLREQARSQGAVVYETQALLMLADLAVRAGANEEALALIAEGLDIATRQGAAFAAPPFHKLRGEALAAREPALAEAAFQESIRISYEQGARMGVLMASLPYARLLQSTHRSLQAHDALAAALEGFAPTPELPAIAEAQALLAELERTEDVQRDRRHQSLRAKYARAVMITEGYTSQATDAAYRRIGVDDAQPRTAEARWSARYGRWSTLLLKGDCVESLKEGEDQLREAERERSPAMTALAHRNIGFSQGVLGRFDEALRHFEIARRLYDESWTVEARATIGADFLAVADSFLGLAAWLTGDLDAAKRHFEAAISRAETTDPGWTLTLVFHSWLLVLGFAHRFEQMLEYADRARAVAAEKSIGALEPVFRLFRYQALVGLRDAAASKVDVSAAWADLDAKGMRTYGQLAHLIIADFEAASGDADDALATIEAGLRFGEEIGYRLYVAPLHTLRGDILAGRDRAAAEAAYARAIAVAREQGGRPFALQAALPLARLLQSENRSPEAHEILSGALEGFVATPEFPIVAEAQALLAQWEATPGFVSIRERERRIAQLRSDYKRAVAWGAGHASTQATGAGSDALTPVSENPHAHYSETVVLAVKRFSVGDWVSGRAIAENAVRELQRTGPERWLHGLGRVLGFCHMLMGDCRAADAQLVGDLQYFAAARGDDVPPLGVFDDEVSVRSYYMFLHWRMGRISQALATEQAALARVAEVAQIGTSAMCHALRLFLHSRLGDREKFFRLVDRNAEIAEQSNIPMYLFVATAYKHYADGMRHDAGAAARGLQQHLSNYLTTGARFLAPEMFTRLAELHALANDREAAIAAAQTGLELVESGCDGYTAPQLYRILAALRLSQPQPDLAATERTLKISLDVAIAQGARSEQLLTAIELFRLLQMTGRLVEAREILTAALEGFAPAPEFPAIAEARALLDEIGAG